MKTNDIKESLRPVIAHMEEATSILHKLYNNLDKNKDKEEPKDNKVKVTIKVENPYDGIEIDEKEFEQIKKDLEEIINDFTRE